MLRKIAEIIAFVFHPLLMSTFLLIILYFFAPSVLRPVDAGSILPILLMVFAITFVIPVISIGMLRLTSSISSMRLEDRRERIMPFFFTAAYYSLMVYLFSYKLVLSETLIILFAAVTVTILLVSFITLFFKISAHAVGMWGALGALVSVQVKYPDSQLFWPIIGSLVLAGAVNSSRLLLNVHSPSEVGLGSVLGFTVCFGAVLVFS